MGVSFRSGALLLWCAIGLGLAACEQQSAGGPAGFADRIAGLEHRPGLIDLYVDHENGAVLAALPAPAEDGGIARYVYAGGMTAGLGSNPVGLDRGSWVGSDIIAFRQSGGHVVAEAENWAFRAASDSDTERQAVRRSFARSVIWRSEILAREAGSDRILVDLTGFLLRDTPRIAARLTAAGEGAYSLDAKRSFVETDTALAFPENVEFDAVLTFTGDKPGREIRAVTPDPTAVSLTLHHSLIRLPEPGYTPRKADPRAGVIGVEHTDFAAPLDAPLDVSLARRFRLEKTDPAADRSPVKTPIVFYVDSGAPEQIRAALMDGIGWWTEAFDAAGFENAFEVKVLPDDVHPLDARYNVVQWVHRQTRGWSFGGGIHDPRTGEMIKGLVVLGSQRVRQDRMIFEGLIGADASGSGAPGDPVEIALDRIRQLGAHEVGHAIGFAHNMAASTYDDRASVMDYPAPLVRVTGDGRLDLSAAYDDGMGAWDRFAVKYLYSDFPPGTDEDAALEEMIRQAQRDGLIYVEDADSRPMSAAHPLGNLWDTGTDPLDALENSYRVRRIALDNFGPRVIADGMPMAQMRQVLAPVYLFHRYQLEAAIKALGGLYFDYRHKGDAGQPTRIEDPARQRRALDLALRSLEPAFLELPEDLLRLLTPHAQGFGGAGPRVETFADRTGAAFDLLAAAEAAAGLTLDRLLEPHRMGRLQEFHRRNARSPSVTEVLETIGERVIADVDSLPAGQQEIARILAARYVDGLIRLSGNEAAAPGVRDQVDLYLTALTARLDGSRLGDATDAALARRIMRHLERPASPAPAANDPLSPPPGSPIGAAAAAASGEMERQCWHCDSPR